MKGRVLGYARVSTRGQADNYSLPAQKAKIDAYAAYHNLGTVLHYAEGISGTRDDRPELLNLLRDLKEGDTVVVYALSRLGRGGVQQLLRIIADIRAKGAKVISLTENIDTDTPTGRLMLTLLAAIAELELEMTRERTEAGRIQALSQGVFPHSDIALPLGYTHDEHGRITTNDLAPLVPLIYELARDRSYQAVAAELDARGIPSPKGTTWNAFAIRRTLKQDAYHTGRLMYGRHARPDQPESWIALPCPTLITSEQFTAAKRDPAKHHNRATPTKYPLTGHLVCACGTRMSSGQVNATRDGTRKGGVYRCQPHVRKSERCPAFNTVQPKIVLKRAHTQARTLLERFFRDPTDPLRVTAAYATHAPPDPHAFERTELQDRLSRLVDLHLADAIDLPEYLKRRADLQDRLATLPTPELPTSVTVPDLADIADTIALLEDDEEDNALLTRLLDAFGITFQLQHDKTLKIAAYQPAHIEEV